MYIRTHNIESCRWGYDSMVKAVDKWLLMGAEADPDFCASL